METEKLELINKILELKQRTDDFTEDITELATTEGSRADILCSIYIRKNRELRLKNLWEIENEFRTQGRYFNQSPERYATSQESIKLSYRELINRFMREYNTRYMSIQNEIYRAEEQQKILMFKCCKCSNSKRVYMLSNDYKNFLEQKSKMIEEYEKNNDFELYKEIENMKDPCELYNEKISNYKRKIKLYENIITRCDDEFEKCTKDRDTHFKELFGEEEQLAAKSSGYKMILNMIMNKIDGNNRFSKLVIKKHASRINSIKTQKMGECADKIKSETVIFEQEIKNMLEQNEV